MLFGRKESKPTEAEATEVVWEAMALTPNTPPTAIPAAATVPATKVRDFHFSEVTKF